MEHAAVALLVHGLDSPNARSDLNWLNNHSRENGGEPLFVGSMQGSFSATRELPDGKNLVWHVEQFLRGNPRLVTTRELAGAFSGLGAGEGKALNSSLNSALGLLEYMGLASKHPFNSRAGKRRVLRWTHALHHEFGRAALEDNVHWWLLQQLRGTGWRVHHNLTRSRRDRPSEQDPYSYASIRSGLKHLAEAGLLLQREAIVAGRPTPEYSLSSKGSRLVARANRGEYPEELRLAILGVNTGVKTNG